MPEIICPKCKTEYKVALSLMGRQVRCRHCGNRFEARVLRSQRHKDWKVKPTVLLLSFLGLGLFVILALIVQSSFHEEPSPPPETRDFARKGAPAPASVQREGPPGEARGIPAQQPERTERERFCLDFLKAVAENDTERLQRMFNFAAYHRIHNEGDTPSLAEMPEVDRVLAKKSYLEALTDDTPSGGGFLRHADVKEVRESAWNGEKGEVEILLENPHNGRRQERRLKLRAVGSRLTVCDWEAGPVCGGDLEEAAPQALTLEEKYARRINPLGEIRRVAYTGETGDAEAERIRGWVQDLLGENRPRARAARTALRRLGKRAVPGLLNALVGLDMTRLEDVGRANTCTSLLRELTGRNFHFIPGFIEESKLESVSADLEAALRRWFGWWERHKESWDGTPWKPEEDGEEAPSTHP